MWDSVQKPPDRKDRAPTRIAEFALFLVSHISVARRIKKREALTLAVWAVALAVDISMYPEVAREMRAYVGGFGCLRFHQGRPA